MNYISEILGFRDYRLLNKLSTGQIALWFALMDVNNMNCWTEWFTVSNRTLESLTGMSREGISKAKNSLRQKGLIDFKSSRAKVTEYKMMSFCTMSNSTQDSTQDSTQGCTTLDKQNKNKINNNINNNIHAYAREGHGNLSDRADVFACFEDNIGVMGTAVFESIEDFRGSGMADDVICEAICDAARNGKHSWRYVEKILIDKQRRGIVTLADYLSDRREWERQKEIEKSGIKQESRLEAKKPPYMRSIVDVLGVPRGE